MVSGRSTWAEQGELFAVNPAKPVTGADEEVLSSRPFQPGRFTRREARKDLSLLSWREAERAIFWQHKADVGAGLNPKMRGNTQQEQRQAECGQSLLPGRFAPAQDSGKHGEAH